MGANDKYRGADIRYDARFFDPTGGCMSDFPPDDADGEAVPQSDRLQILLPEEGDVQDMCEKVSQAL